ncbi:dihydrolipoyl dehydrogenase [Lactarius indigo]|nr:dihydrolipoyl dehydrogenase [Lactarius indigo]
MLGGTHLNVGCILSKAMLNNSQICHQTLHDIKKRGIDDVKLNPPKVLKAKEDSVDSFTKSIEILFKVNKVDYIIKIGGGGESTMEAKSIMIAIGSVIAPFPDGAIEIDSQQIVSSTGALSLQKVNERVVIIDGSTVRLEMGRVWSRPRSLAAKQFQNAMTKQGLKFKLSTKALSSEKKDRKVVVTTEAGKDGMHDSLETDVVLVAVGRRPYIQDLGLENVGVEVDSRGRIATDDQFNTSVPKIKHIGDVTFGPMLAHKAEEEGIAAVEYIHRGHGHVNYGTIPSVVYMYMHPEYKVGRFQFLANLRAKTNLDTEGRVKLLIKVETDRILGCTPSVGPNAGAMIAEGMLALEYGANTEGIARTTHTYPMLSEAFRKAATGRIVETSTVG